MAGSVDSLLDSALCRGTGVPKNILFDFPELQKSAVPVLIRSLTAQQMNKLDQKMHKSAKCDEKKK
jgi:hypothetical protein